MGVLSSLQVQFAEKEVNDIETFNWNVIGACRSEKERKEIIEKGWKRINAVINGTPKCGYAYYLRGHYQELFGKDTEALDDYNKAEELDVSDGFRALTLYLSRSQLKTKMKDYAGADNDLTKAIELSKIISGLISPTAAELHIQRGVVRRFKNELEDAMEDYQYAIRNGNKAEQEKAEHYIRLLNIETKLSKPGSIKPKDEKHVSDTAVTPFDMRLKIWFVSIFFMIILAIIGVVVYFVWMALTGNKLK